MGVQLGCCFAIETPHDPQITFPTTVYPMSDSFDFKAGRPKRVGLAEVAAAAGVSKATVCRVLLERGRISPATRQRIKEIADKMGYQSDPALSALTRYRWGERVSAKERYSIACVLVCPHPDSPGSVLDTTTVKGLETRAAEMSFIFEKHLLNSHVPPEKLSQTLYARGVDGIVFVITGPVFNWSFHWHRFACVTMGFDGEHHTMNSVTSDWFSALGMVSAKAVEAGRTKIGFANFFRGNPSIDTRIHGATVVERERLTAKFGRQPTIHWYPKDRNLDKPLFKTEGEAFLRWFEKEKPDVVIDGNCMAHWWLRDSGIRIPEDVAYVSLNAQYQKEPHIAGAVHQLQRQGRIAVDFLFNLIQSNERGLGDSPIRLTTPCGWHSGASLPGI